MAVREVDAGLGIDSGRVLTLSVAGQGSSLGWGSDAGVQASVGVTVRIVGAGRGIDSSRVLVTSNGVADLVGVDGSIGLRLGSRSSVPLLWLGSGIPVGLSSGS